MSIPIKGAVLSYCLLTACGAVSPDPSQENQATIYEAETLAVDGLYSVRQVARSKSEFASVEADERIAQVRFGGETTYLLVGETPDVPLNLDCPGKNIPQGDGTCSVQLEFDKDARETLATLTRDLAAFGGTVATVVGGTVVS